MDRRTIVVSGMVAGDPHQGGATWAVLQYVLGLRRLGHDVYLVEPVEQASRETEVYFREVVARFELEERAALLLTSTGATIGLPYEAVREAARRADILLNVSGMLRDEGLTGEIPTRVYLDLDPAFNQLWHAVEGIDVGFAGHTRYVTVGQAIGDPDCPVPTCGLDWITTLQPVVLPLWPQADGTAWDAFTTVGNWRGYGSIEANGVFYGQKAHSLREVAALPTLTNERFVLALAIHPDERRDLELLAQNGWHLVDPGEVAGTPAAYREFVRGSKAELGIAKSGYVVSRCGWFSDRSACYLAAARPVVAQETGFSRFLPTGEGLFSFETGDDVAAAAGEIGRDYGRHSRAARAIAEEYFDSDKVLARLLERL